MTAKNILFLILDGLSQREFPVDGPVGDLIPTFQELATGGYAAQQCYAHGSTTEFAIPSLLSSTLPLDYGGYQYGLWNRPTNMFEILKQNGYRTGLFTGSFVLDRLFGFDRDLDAIQSFYDIESMWRYQRKNFLQHFSDRFQATRDRDKFQADLVETLNRFFAATHQAAAVMLDQARQGLGGRSRMDRHDFQAIMIRLEQEFERFSQNEADYVDANWRKILSSGLEEFLNLSPYSRRVRNTLLKLDGKKLPGSEILFRGFEKNAPGERILNAAADWILQSPDDRPFAATVHLMDVHDGLCSSAPYFIRPDPEIARRYRRMGCPGDISPRHLQALAYVDRCLYGLFQRLEKAGLRQDLTVIVTSDHGTVWINGQSCLASSAPPGSFKDAYLSIPFLAHGPGITPRRDERLQQSMNILPSLLDCLEISPPDSLQGHSVFNSAQSLDHVIAEHTHRGPCDPHNKPIYLAIRSATHKYVWKEAFAPHDQGPDLEEQLFDLTHDPGEENSIHNQPEAQPILNQMRERRLQRVQAIRAHPPYRLAQVGQLSCPPSAGYAKPGQNHPD